MIFLLSIHTSCSLGTGATLEIVYDPGLLCLLSEAETDQIVTPKEEDQYYDRRSGLVKERFRNLLPGKYTLIASPNRESYASETILHQIIDIREGRSNSIIFDSSSLKTIEINLENVSLLKQYKENTLFAHIRRREGEDFDPFFCIWSPVRKEDNAFFIRLVGYSDGAEYLITLVARGSIEGKAPRIYLAQADFSKDRKLYNVQAVTKEQKQYIEALLDQ